VSSRVKVSASVQLDWSCLRVCEEIMESPKQTIVRLSQELSCTPTSRRLAEHLDRLDPLRHLRLEFLMPTTADLPNGEPNTSHTHTHSWVHEQSHDRRHAELHHDVFAQIHAECKQIKFGVLKKDCSQHYMVNNLFEFAKYFIHKCRF